MEMKTTLIKIGILISIHVDHLSNITLAFIRMFICIMLLILLI